MDDPETGEIAYFSHPIDIHFATRFANIFRFLPETGFPNKSHLLIVILIITVRAVYYCPYILTTKLSSSFVYYMKTTDYDIPMKNNG